MLVAAAVLDLTRCGLVLAAPRHLALAAGLVVAGLCAAAISMWTARECRRGLHWPGWAALLIGAASAPQAAALGYRAPYTIPDTATAVLGVLLTVTVLAAAGRNGPPWRHTGNPSAVGRREASGEGGSQASADGAMNSCPAAFVLRGKGSLGPLFSWWQKPWRTIWGALAAEVGPGGGHAAESAARLPAGPHKRAQVTA